MILGSRALKKQYNQHQPASNNCSGTVLDVSSRSGLWTWQPCLICSTFTRTCTWKPRSRASTTKTSELLPDRETMGVSPLGCWSIGFQALGKRRLWPRAGFGMTCYANICIKVCIYYVCICVYIHQVPWCVYMWISCYLLFACYLS